MFKRQWTFSFLIVWLGLVSVVGAFFVVGVPDRYDQLRQPCISESEECVFFQLSPASVAALDRLGLSLTAYASYMTVFVVLPVVSYLTIAILIVARRSREPAALFVSFVLVAFLPTYFVSVTQAVVQAHPGWDLVVRGLQALGLWSAILFTFLFPNGRFVPSWGRWLAAIATAATPILFWYPVNHLFRPNASAIETGVSAGVVALLIAGAWSQVYRFRRTANPAERQQVKWVVFGLAILVSHVTLYDALPALLPAMRAPGTAELLYFAIGALTAGGAVLLWAATFAVSILRYRLFDIDVLINRALVYGAVSMTLAGVYWLIIVLAQLALQPLIHSRSSVVVAGSTLGVAALFQPLRRRFQTTIDRHFYRRKYDTSSVIDAFSRTARHEVDLNRLCDQLLSVVQETMQPESTSLWLRPPSRRADLPALATIAPGDPGRVACERTTRPRRD